MSVKYQFPFKSGDRSEDREDRSVLYIIYYMNLNIINIQFEMRVASLIMNYNILSMLCTILII